MLALLVVLAQVSSAATVDSTYATAAIRQLVERASVSNRRVPESLRGYRARVESELAFVARQGDGTEQTFSVEQTENVVHWDRSGPYEQRVVGYRSQSVGLTLSAVGMFRQAWTVPILYGNRITLLFGQQDSTRRRRRGRPDITVAVHPFADDRGGRYRFSGGDTVVTINPGSRDIPVVRVHVEPRGDRLTRSLAAFRGDIELDAQRAEIVRLRGYFVTLGPKPNIRSRVFDSQFETIAYVELENGEFEQRYWLPTYQRIEAQATLSLLGEQRAVFRVISRFHAMVVNPPETSIAVNRGDTLRLAPYRLTFAPADSIRRFADWSRDLGEATSAVRADDFTDLAPDRWRPTGRPLVRLRFQDPADLFHYNRVEGPYTGVAVEARLRDAAPGWIVRGTIGRGWSDGAVRGRALIERQHGQWWPSVRVGRSLDITNDFREPFDSGSTLGALFSVDDYDYVDRRIALVGLTRFLTRQRDVWLRLEGGFASDGYVAATRDRGPLARGDSGFRFNRGVDAGQYRLATLKLAVHPDVNAAFVRPGLGALLQAETASGDIDWRRVELRLVARRTFGPMIYAARADAGVVAGDSIPAQQLFELGENQNLPGYGYKEFAGNEAVVIRGLAMYPLPLWRAPLRLGRMVLPGVAPMVSFGAQSGWAGAPTAAARSAIVRLGTTGDSTLGNAGSVTGSPVSRPTAGLKSSIDFRLRFFGGAVSVGVARAIDHHQSWRIVAGLAQVL